MAHVGKTMLGGINWEYFGAILCLLSPGWLLLVFWLLIRYVKRPGEARTDQHAFELTTKDDALREAEPKDSAHDGRQPAPTSPDASNDAKASDIARGCEASGPSE